MKPFAAPLVIALLVAAAGCGNDSPPPLTGAPAAGAARDINAFALDLYAGLAEEKRGENLFFSPYSVSTALTMTYAGARGNTANEMRKALRFSLDDAKLYPAVGSLVSDLSAAGARSGFQFSMANTLWIQEGRPFLPAFLALNSDCYGAAFETLDLSGDPKASRKAINARVERQTEGKIGDLVPQGVIDELTRLVLTNAVYFVGNWKEPFPENFTRDMPFELRDGKTVNAPTMCLQDTFRYAEGRGFQAAGY